MKRTLSVVFSALGTAVAVLSLVSLIQNFSNVSLNKVGAHALSYYRELSEYAAIIFIDSWLSELFEHWQRPAWLMDVIAIWLLCFGAYVNGIKAHEKSSGIDNDEAPEDEKLDFMHYATGLLFAPYRFISLVAFQVGQLWETHSYDHFEKVTLSLEEDYDREEDFEHANETREHIFRNSRASVISALLTPVFTAAFFIWNANSL